MKNWSSMKVQRRMKIHMGKWCRYLSALSTSDWQWYSRDRCQRSSLLTECNSNWYSPPSLSDCAQTNIWTSLAFKVHLSSDLWLSIWEIWVGVNGKPFCCRVEGMKMGRRNLKLCVMRWKFLFASPSKLHWMVIYLFITCFMKHQQKVENFIPMINETLLMPCKFLSFRDSSSHLLNFSFRAKSFTDDINFHYKKLAVMMNSPCCSSSSESSYSFNVSNSRLVILENFNFAQKMCALSLCGCSEERTAGN